MIFEILVLIVPLLFLLIFISPLKLVSKIVIIKIKIGNEVAGIPRYHGLLLKDSIPIIFGICPAMIAVMAIHIAEIPQIFRVAPVISAKTNISPTPVTRYNPEKSGMGMQIDSLFATVGLSISFRLGVHLPNRVKLMKSKALKECKIVPVIWLKDNMSLSKLLSMISTPLTYFLENKMKELSFFKKLAKILIHHLKRLDELKSKRLEVEDVFKLGKCGLFMDKIHKFTRKSVAKFVYANVLLIAILIRLGFREKKVLQRLAEW